MTSPGDSTARAWRRFRRTFAPSATYVLITITLLVFLLQLIPGLRVTDALLFSPAYVMPGSGAPFEPWRLLTVALVHSPQLILHIVFNMVALWMFGQQLESALGMWRFLAVYALSTLGGSVAVVYLGAPYQGVVGASGAIFGLLGAFFIVARKLGANTVGLVVMIVLNLGIGLVVRTISWQAHVGGLLAGMLVAWIIVETRKRTQRTTQYALLGAVAVALLVAALVPGLLGIGPR
ncbi:MAG TPA: rhomboid family intramembrane serine protease [Naasia sp.]